MAKSDKKTEKNKEIDVNRGLELLREMEDREDGPSPKHRSSSIRQLVFKGYAQIKKLMGQGYSRRQICDYLRQNLNADFSDTTFYNYLHEASKTLGNPEESTAKPEKPAENAEHKDIELRELKEKLGSPCKKVPVVDTSKYNPANV